MDTRRLGVQPDVVVVEFLTQSFVLVDLEDREHEHREIGRSDDRQHLLAAAAAVGRALDQPRHVEDLDVRAAVFEHPGVDI